MFINPGASSGSGMTVRYVPILEYAPPGSSQPGRHLLNLLPLRRVSPRLLTQGDTGTRFIKEVEEVRRANQIKRQDLNCTIYYLTILYDFSRDGTKYSCIEEQERCSFLHFIIRAEI